MLIVIFAVRRADLGSIGTRQGIAQALEVGVWHPGLVEAQPLAALGQHLLTASYESSLAINHAKHCAAILVLCIA